MTYFQIALLVTFLAGVATFVYVPRFVDANFQD